MADTDSAASDRRYREVVTGFAADLAKLRELQGNPSFEKMYRAIRHDTRTAGSKNTFHRMVTKPDRIYEPEFVRGFVLALGLGDKDAAIWEERRVRALLELQAMRKTQMVEVETASPSQRRNSITAKTLLAPLMLVLAILAAAIFLNVFSRKSNIPQGASAGAATAKTPRDGADPVDSGCSRLQGVHILDNAEVDFAGLPVGLAELVYSPLCGVSWARFEPFIRAKIPAGATIKVDVVRVSPHRMTEPYSAPYVGEPVYGNVLQSTESCVYATVTIEVHGRQLPASDTRCFRGDVPVQNTVRSG